MVDLTRRRYLSVLGAIGAGGLAGCTSDGQERNEPTRTDTVTVTATRTPTESPPESREQPETSTPEATGTPVPSDVGGAPMFRYDAANTGAAPDESGPTADVTDRWRFEDADGKDTFLSVQDGTVYVDSNSLLAMDAVDGTVRWTTDEAMGTPAIADGTVYTGGSTSVYAVAVEDGTRQWRTRIGRPDAPITLAGGTVYVGSGVGEARGGDHFLRAIDANDGTERWQFDEREGRFSVPAVADGTVFVANDGEWGTNTRLYAFDAADGRKLWQFTIENSWQNKPMYNPAVSDGTVYIAYAATIYAIDSSDGTKLWEFQFDQIGVSDLAVHDGTVYAGSSRGHLTAIDANGGTEQWRLERATDRVHAPVVVGGTVYSAGGRIVYAVDATSGKELWRFVTRHRVTASPTVVDGVVFVPAVGDVYALTEVTDA